MQWWSPIFMLVLFYIFIFPKDHNSWLLSERTSFCSEHKTPKIPVLISGDNWIFTMIDNGCVLAAMCSWMFEVPWIVQWGVKLLARVTGSAATVNKCTQRYCRYMLHTPKHSYTLLDLFTSINQMLHYSQGVRQTQSNKSIIEQPSVTVMHKGFTEIMH